MLCFVALKKVIVIVNDIADEICTAYGSSATTITIIRDWFKKFRVGNFDLKVREKVDAINMSRNNHLIKIGYVDRFEI